VSPTARFAALALSFGVLLGGCTSTSTNVVPDEATGRGYRVGMRLELRSDRLLEASAATLASAPPALVRQSLRTPGAPVTIDDVRRSAARYPHIVGIVPSGTRLVVTAIEHRTYVGLEAWFEVTARITAGSFAGRTVSLDAISAHGADGRSPLIDPNELVILD
jgi:pectin methylesterase-like acyl-CoA thioesterase